MHIFEFYRSRAFFWYIASHIKVQNLESEFQSLKEDFSWLDFLVMWLENEKKEKVTECVIQWTIIRAKKEKFSYQNVEISNFCWFNHMGNFVTFRWFFEKTEKVTESVLLSQRFSDLIDLNTTMNSWDFHFLPFLVLSFQLTIDDVICMTHLEKLSKKKL